MPSARARPLLVMTKRMGSSVSVRAELVASTATGRRSSRSMSDTLTVATPGLNAPLVAVMVTDLVPSGRLSLTPEIWNGADDWPLVSVIEAGTVASPGWLEASWTTRFVAVLVLRVTRPVAEPDSAMTPRSMVTVKAGPSSSAMVRFVEMTASSSGAPVMSSVGKTRSWVKRGPSTKALLTTWTGTTTEDSLACIVTVAGTVAAPTLVLTTVKRATPAGAPRVMVRSAAGLTAFSGTRFWLRLRLSAGRSLSSSVNDAG